MDTIVVQFLSHVWLFATPWMSACRDSPSFTITQSILTVMSIDWVISANHLILCCTFSNCPQSFPALGSFPKSWLFEIYGLSTKAWTSVLPMNICRWLPLGLTVWSPLIQHTFKSLFQHYVHRVHSLLLSFLYGPTLTSVHDSWKTIALIIWTFVSKVMSQLFNMLSRFVIASLSGWNQVYQEKYKQP